MYTVTVNKAGDTPLSLAYEEGHFEVVKYLAVTHHCSTESKSGLASCLYLLCCIEWNWYSACMHECINTWSGIQCIQQVIRGLNCVLISQQITSATTFYLL